MKVEVKGVTVKLSGACDLVTELSDFLDETCVVVHSSRVVYHSEDGGCHLYKAITEVKSD